MKTMQIFFPFSGLFNISQDFGTIYLNQSFERDVNTSFSLIIIASNTLVDLANRTRRGIKIRWLSFRTELLEVRFTRAIFYNNVVVFIEFSRWSSQTILRAIGPGVVNGICSGTVSLEAYSPLLYTMVIPCFTWMSGWLWFDVDPGI